MRSRSGKAQVVIAGNEPSCDRAVRDVHHENRFAPASQIFLLARPIAAGFRPSGSQSAGRRRGRHNSRDACRTSGSPIFRSAQSPGCCARWTSSRIARRRCRRLAASSAAAKSSGPTPRRRHGARPRWNKAGPARARRKKHQRIAGELAALLGDDQRGVRRGEEMAKASPRQPVDRKDGVSRARSAASRSPMRPRRSLAGSERRRGDRLTMGAPASIPARSLSPTAPAGRLRPAACPSAAG